MTTPRAINGSEDSGADAATPMAAPIICMKPRRADAAPAFFPKGAIVCRTQRINDAHAEKKDQRRAQKRQETAIYKRSHENRDATDGAKHQRYLHRPFGPDTFAHSVPYQTGRKDHENRSGEEETDLDWTKCHQLNHHARRC